MEMKAEKHHVPEESHLKTGRFQVCSRKLKGKRCPACLVSRIDRYEIIEAAELVQLAV